MAIPTSDMRGHSSLRERIVLALDRCQEQQWLDFKESQPWDVLKWRILKTIMAMANLRDGGLVIIGVSERGDSWDLTGISSDHISTYDHDDIIDQVTKYASPEVKLDIVIHSHDDEKSYLAIHVHQFNETPVVCKRNGPDGVRERDRIAAGDFFVRPPGKPQTVKVADAARLHDLLELAAENRARRMLEVAHRVGLVASESAADLFEAELSTITEFPVPVHEVPHWRVIIRPDHYNEELITTRSNCLKLVEKSRVRLRGWDFPAGTSGEGHITQGSSWVGFSCEFMDTIEFWRFFQSGQFAHWSAVREVTSKKWTQQLADATSGHLRHVKDFDWKSVPGYISIINTLNNITEAFEFAARLAQSGLYEGTVQVRIELHGIKGFILTTDNNRMWRRLCVAEENNLEKTWNIQSDDLIANSANHSLKAVVWFFESFGWMEPNLESLRRDQQKLLQGLV